jgi:hypothetical protein
MKLIKALVLMPYLLYLNLAEKLVRFFFKIVFLVVKVTENVPIIGPKVSRTVARIAEWRVFSWALKNKQD